MKPGARRHRHPRAWAVMYLFRVMAVVTALLLVAGTALVALTWREPVGDAFAFRGFQVGVAVMYVVVGAVIVSRRPSHPVGRLLSVIGLLTALDMYLQFYAVYTVQQAPGSLPGGHLTAWLQNWLWIWIAVTAGPILVLLFPSGSLQSPRWRVGIGLALVAAVTFSFNLMLTPGPLNALPLIDNPYGIAGVDLWLEGIEIIGGASLVTSYIIAIVSLIVRMRRSRGVERLQLKWLSFAAALQTIAFILYPLTETLSTPYVFKVNQAAVLAGLVGVPLAVGIAVLRYRLYEIDRIINRAVVYGMLTVSLALMYVGIVFSLGGVARALSGASSSPVTAFSTLAVAALFLPLRARIQTAVDRRFYRHKYDAAHTIELFSTRLRDEVHLDELTRELEEIVGRTMQPEHMSLWLRGVKCGKS